MRISDWSSDVCSSDLQLMVLNFAKMIDSETIARSALADLGLERDPSQVVESTTAEPEPGTQLPYVTVTDPDPEMAQTPAHGMADTFVTDLQEFEPGVPEGTVPRTPDNAFERAKLPQSPVPTQ